MIKNLTILQTKAKRNSRKIAFSILFLIIELKFYKNVEILIFLHERI